MLPQSQSAPFNPHPGYIAGRSYALFEGYGVGLALAAVDMIYFFPFRIYRTLNFSGGNAYVVTGGAGSAIKAAIWANSPVSNRPLGAPLYKDDTGIATTASSTAVALAFGAGALAPGYYWAGVKGTGTLPVMVSTGSFTQISNYLAGVAGGSPGHTMLRFADAYANAMPSFAEGATFVLSGAFCPLLNLTSA